jgi:hypothetical protein
MHQRFLVIFGTCHSGLRAGISLRLMTYGIKYEIPEQARDDKFTVTLSQLDNFSEVSKYFADVIFL